MYANIGWLALETNVCDCCFVSDLSATAGVISEGPGEGDRIT